MKIIGIYVIINIINEKTYIGQSLDVKNRIRKHKYLLNKGVHSNKYLQSSHIKHGSENFKFEILYEINDFSLSKEQIVDKLNIKEIDMIIKYDSFYNGYNLTTGGEGYNVSEITKKRLSESHKGQIPSELCKKKTSERFKGVSKSEETKNRMSLASKNKKKNYEVWNKGKPGYKTKPASNERKLKISSSQIGNKNHNYGKKISELTKQNCRDTYHGEQCHLAKLNDNKVIEIKNKLTNGIKGVELAKMYNISTTTISRIKLGKIWKHIN